MVDSQSTRGFSEGPEESQGHELVLETSNCPEEVENLSDKTECEHTVGQIKRYDGPRNAKNEPNGYGTAKLTNGDKYEGTFRKGLFHGSGVLRQRTGHRYEGKFRKGHRDGRGTQTYPDCSTYDGDWRKGIRHGYGLYRYTNKDTFEGNWCTNKKHGIGTYTFAENGVRLRGAWNAGNLDGPVKILFDGIRYHGRWSGTGLADTEESVFNVASKYLVRGFMKCGSFDEYVWSPRCIERYSFARLPLEPLPVPTPDDQQSSSSASDCSVTDDLNCV